MPARVGCNEGLGRSPPCLDEHKHRRLSERDVPAVGRQVFFEAKTELLVQAKQFPDLGVFFRTETRLHAKNRGLKLRF